MVVQLVVFTGCALVLLVLRSNDLTAALSVLALALSAVGGGGPLLGVENRIPLGAGHVLTIFAWLASPLAFPIIALAILYFPSRSPLLVRHPALHAVPFLAAAPMIGLSLMTALYLTGVDALRDLARLGRLASGRLLRVVRRGARDQRRRRSSRGSTATASTTTRNERRRIRMAVYTAVPGVLAYALKDGVPIVAMPCGVRAARATPQPRSSSCRCSCCCRRSGWSTRSASRASSGRASCCAAACSTRSRAAR